MTTTIFSCVHLLVNKSVESKHVGKMNGFGQAVNSGSKALGPLIIATIFAYSISTASHDSKNELESYDNLAPLESPESTPSPWRSMIAFGFTSLSITCTAYSAKRLLIPSLHEN